MVLVCACVYVNIGWFLFVSMLAISIYSIVDVLQNERYSHLFETLDSHFGFSLKDQVDPQ